MEKLSINAEFLFELKDKKDWVNKVPGCLPQKMHPGEEWIWVDALGSAFVRGADFTAAERIGSYPCKVYRLVTVDRFEVMMNKING